MYTRIKLGKQISLTISSLIITGFILSNISTLANAEDDHLVRILKENQRKSVKKIKDDGLYMLSPKQLKEIQAYLQPGEKTLYNLEFINNKAALIDRYENNLKINPEIHFLDNPENLDPTLEQRSGK